MVIVRVFLRDPGRPRRRLSGGVCPLRRPLLPLPELLRGEPIRHRL